MDKQRIAEILEEIASLLELQGANPFRIQAYRNAARSLLNTDKTLEELLKKKELSSLPGIGEDLAEKITQLASRKRLPFYEKLKKSTPKGILKLLQLQGLGPKKIRTLHQKLHIDSIASLKKACTEGKIKKLKGFGEKTQKNILEAIQSQKTYEKRYLWWNAMETAEELLSQIQTCPEVEEIQIAGSLRRKLETIGDLDFVVASKNPDLFLEWFKKQPFIFKTFSEGASKIQIQLKNKMRADFRIVKPQEFGFAHLHFTGSKEHNISLRERALKKGFSLSEYGLQGKKGSFAFRKKSPSEADIYQALDLVYIPPELRENRGEIEMAEKNKLPHLVQLKDIRGTFHNHTTASDGRNTLDEMALAAEKLGWEYLGISDHSQSSVQANGLSEERLLAQIQQIKELNAAKKYRLHLFSGTECDILPDGKLDFPDSVLNRLDFVIGSIHSSFRQDEKTITKRLIRAIEHPRLTIIGHLTGRLLLQREGYAINIQKVIDACIANHKIIEINGQPSRLDMDWRFWHAASEKGLLCCINTDAHSVSHHAFLKGGVFIAQKGWLGKRQILNTQPLKEIKSYFNL